MDSNTTIECCGHSVTLKLRILLALSEDAFVNKDFTFSSSSTPRTRRGEEGKRGWNDGRR